MSKVTKDYLEVTGKSKIVYKFEIYTLDTEFNAVGGVYIFTQRTMNKNGYDQNYVVDRYTGLKMIDVAKVKSEKTGVEMKVSTNLPGFQFYTANNLGKSAQPEGKNGKRYEKHSSFCVEPQFFPDAINSFDEKPILKKGEKYNRTIEYSFSVNK